MAKKIILGEETELTEREEKIYNTGFENGNFFTLLILLGITVFMLLLILIIDFATTKNIIK